MEFFEKVFNWLEGLSSKLPTINLKMYFIIVLAAIALVWVITAFTLLSSRSQRLIRASKRIRKYLAGVDSVDDDNVSDFTALCFGSKAPQPLRDAWMQYLGVRFGYPSEIVSDKNVYDRLVKKHKDIRSGIYLAISLILLALFAFWGYGTLDGISMGVIHLAGLVLIAITYLLLIIFYRNQCKRCLEAFENMQDDLDAKVNLQIESNYATDSSPLSELTALVEEIIARNTAKVVELDENQGPTPIEELIEQAPELAEQPIETLEQSDDIVVEQPVIEEPLMEEPVIEQPLVEEAASENVEPEQAEPAVEEAPIAEADNENELEALELENLEELEDEQEPQAQETEIQESEGIDEALLQEVEESEDLEELTEAADEVELAEIDEQPEEELAAVDEGEQFEEEPAEEQEAPKIRKSVVYDSAAGVGGVLSADYSMAAEEDSDEDELDDEPVEEQEPEVVYVVDGDEDDDAIVKPAKLAKLPNLVDYMLTKDMPKAMKIQIATLLISTYKKFEHSKEDRAIVVQCLTKVMQALQK